LLWFWQNITTGLQLLYSIITNSDLTINTNIVYFLVGQWRYCCCFFTSRFRTFPVNFAKIVLHKNFLLKHNKKRISGIGPAVHTWTSCTVDETAVIMSFTPVVAGVITSVFFDSSDGEFVKTFSTVDSTDCITSGISLPV